MKAYSEYMNGIAMDAPLREAILRRAGAPRPARRGLIQPAVRFAMAAAVVLLCIFTVPPLINRTAEHTSIPTVPPITRESTAPDDAAACYPAPEDAAALPDVPLNVNEGGNQISASRHIPGHFWYALTDAQYAALFPDFEALRPDSRLPSTTTAHYRGDGSLFSVVLYEIDANGDTAVYGGSYVRTEITLAPGEVFDCVVYDFTPVVTEVLGAEVIAGVFDWQPNDGVALYMADFQMGGIAYAVRLHDSDTGTSGAERLTSLVNILIRHGAPDMAVLANPVIPYLRDDALSLPEACADPDFGAAIPANVPGWLVFEEARRFVNQAEDSLSASWHTGYDYLNWYLSSVREEDITRAAGPAEREKYDLALYPIPRADSVPDALWEVVNNPVFLAETLTLDMVYARAYQIDDSGDTPGWRMNFSVLAGGTVIRVASKGVTPEEMWAMLAGIRR